jgi:Fic-DOC domain mobile mystery protein B
VGNEKGKEKMTADTFATAPGATPLAKDEAAGLIPTYISTQGELNAVEQENILKAELWLSHSRKPEGILSEKFMRQLHREMFGNVWRWAGKYRTSEKSIGVPWSQVPTAVKTMLDNARYQLENKVYEPDELAARLHHRAVEIHAFANGNGRHARYMSDALLQSLGNSRFSWGASAELGQPGTARTAYIAALKAADNKKFALLLKFVRS